jgi:NTE family protein
VNLQLASQMDSPEPLCGKSIAIALSGGGSRAMAFHLGCLRALHAHGILEQAKTISAVSGGSVLAALYCQHSGDFASFEAKVRSVLSCGFVGAALKKAVTTSEGIKVLACLFPLVITQLGATILRYATLACPMPRNFRRRLAAFLNESSFPRFASRTTILKRVFADELFKRQMLTELRGDRPKLIIIACELRTKSAFYFARDGVGSWRLGKTDPAQVQIAHAVAASAAYPGLLPALDEYLTLEKKGEHTRQRVILTDGGVYDNLGLAPLWPDREAGISLHAERYDTIVACRAGYGFELSPPPVFWPSRMLAVINAIHGRAQNFAMTRLFDLQKTGLLQGFIIPYLGQADDRLRHPPADLVTASCAAAYPTDFSAMSEEWIEKLSKRGEQLTFALLREHLPHLTRTYLASGSSA